MKSFQIIKSKFSSLVTRQRLFWRDRQGNAAIEFAILSPIFLLIMAASCDMGALIYARFQLEAAVSNSASYTIAHSDQIDGINDSALAKNLALLIAGQYTSGDASASITINDGIQANFAGPTIKIDGTSSSTGACYCPTGAATSFIWGSQQTCSSPCPDRANAGKYVVITAKQAYSPMFSDLGIVKDGFIYANAVVQTK